MRVYVDSSALIKRAVHERESDALDTELDRYISDDAVLVSSSLAWIEVSRALSSRLHDVGPSREEAHGAISAALSGVAECPIGDEVVALARRIAPPVLRTLDAVHLATAMLLDVDVVLTYDDRLADACRHNDLSTSAPGR
ncbi:type II toxin-antitoxin system VapC family toxin [Georgenia sp. 10Sc9-8]|uniref:Ribonuclease VapC n=1 Tax=Georgenia halotolerans TaxID=3028317 RepID=A0ABT5U0P4_9MICO|nr:type II toxin-antitoxin system VapC family toxin [Georgenia halotolerans]